MLDIKDIRLNTEEYKRRLGTRGVKPEEIDELVAEDKKRRELLVETENLKKERNEVSEAIAQAKQTKMLVNNQAMRKVGTKIKELDEKLAKVEENVNLWLLTCLTYQIYYSSRTR